MVIHQVNDIEYDYNKLQVIYTELVQPLHLSGGVECLEISQIDP